MAVRVLIQDHPERPILIGIDVRDGVYGLLNLSPEDALTLARDLNQTVEDMNA